jgi:hypothetical protein
VLCPFGLTVPVTFAELLVRLSAGPVVALAGPAAVAGADSAPATSMLKAAAIATSRLLSRIPAQRSGAMVLFLYPADSVQTSDKRRLCLSRELV